MTEKDLLGYQRDMETWMDHIHENPELSMEEEDTAPYIASVLKSFGGWEVTEGVGKYGIVASMIVGDGKKSIGLRADFDAIPTQEDNLLPYKSHNPGVAHLCGHDGHTTMLLGAGKYLADHPDFNGTVRLIFQPGEETMQGGPSMIADGLFERFPVDMVFGMHNIPGLERGKFYFKAGQLMSAVDNWEITLTGKGSHGSMPEISIDPIVCGSSLVMSLQTIVSRNVSPFHNTVVNVGAFNAGIAGNSVPQNATLKISVRNMDNEDRIMVLDKIRLITKATAEAYNCQYEIHEGQPGTVLVNDEEATRFATLAAQDTFVKDRVFTDVHPYMSSEDFAFMLEKKKGNYCMLGNGDTQMVHHPRYVFDQSNLPVGAAYWVSLVLHYLK